MTTFVVIASIIVALNAVALYRVAVGETVYDRLLAAGAVGTNSIVLLAVVGFIFERPDMFVDLAISYALLNFIGAVAAGKYLESHREEAVDADEGSRA